jgi:hypothetical protein
MHYTLYTDSYSNIIFDLLLFYSDHIEWKYVEDNSEFGR